MAADKPPLYYSKHPCETCKTGYGFCAQGMQFSLRCCEGCKHPTRWTPDAWDKDDLAEMEEERRERNREAGRVEPRPQQRPPVGSSKLLIEVLRVRRRD
jgi:hypothetical protein